MRHGTAQALILVGRAQHDTKAWTRPGLKNGLARGPKLNGLGPSPLQAQHEPELFSNIYCIFFTTPTIKLELGTKIKIS